MMTEKEMVNDALNNINSTLTSYAGSIAQTENQQLRSTLIQMRNQAEKSQYDLYTIAKNLNYYTPAQQASQDEIQKVKSQVSGCGSSSKTTEQESTTNQKLDNYISSQSNGLLDHVDQQTKDALQAPPKSEQNTMK